MSDCEQGPPKWPRRVYLNWDHDGEDWFLVAHIGETGLAEMDETTAIGVYDLISEASLTVNRTLAGIDGQPPKAISGLIDS